MGQHVHSEIWSGWKSAANWIIPVLLEFLFQFHIVFPGSCFLGYFLLHLPFSPSPLPGVIPLGQSFWCFFLFWFITYIDLSELKSCEISLKVFSPFFPQPTFLNYSSYMVRSSIFFTYHISSSIIFDQIPWHWPPVLPVFPEISPFLSWRYKMVTLLLVLVHGQYCAGSLFALTSGVSRRENVTCTASGLLPGS